MSFCTVAFCLANLYVNVEVTGQPVLHEDKGNYEGYWCYNHWCHGPLATLKIGMPVLVNDHAVIYYGIKHTSFLSDRSDLGQNTWFVSFTYMPFAR